jgi:hypothetical protein
MKKAYSIDKNGSIMKETIVLLAHGNQRPGSFSNPKIKIITKSGEPLDATDVRSYLSGKSYPEFSSSSLGDFGGVDDEYCLRDLGVVPAVGPGFVDSGKRRSGDMTGYRVFVLRNQNASFAEIGVFAQQFEKVILLACRS